MSFEAFRDFLYKTRSARKSLLTVTKLQKTLKIKNYWSFNVLSLYLGRLYGIKKQEKEYTNMYKSAFFATAQLDLKSLKIRTFIKVQNGA